MPKLKRKVDRWGKMREAIQGRKATLRLTYEELASRIGASKSTVSRWCNQPETMSLADYIDLMAALDFKDYEAKALIPWR